MPPTTKTAATTATQTQEEKAKTASQMVREEALRLAQGDEAVRLRAAAEMAMNTSWGDKISKAQLMALEKVALGMGLSISAGDVIMLGGTPYITIKGHLRLAHVSGKFSGFIEDVLPKEEWDAWGVRPDAEYAWKCTVKRADCEEAFTEVGWGGGSREKEANKGGGQPVAKAFPAEMARKRARARALDLAFPSPLPHSPAEMGYQIPEDIYAKAVVQSEIQMPRRASEAAPEPEAPHVSSATPTPEELRELEAAEQADMLRSAE